MKIVADSRFAVNFFYTLHSNAKQLSQTVSETILTEYSTHLRNSDMNLEASTDLSMVLNCLKSYLRSRNIDLGHTEDIAIADSYSRTPEVCWVSRKKALYKLLCVSFPRFMGIRTEM